MKILERWARLYGPPAFYVSYRNGYPNQYNGSNMALCFLHRSAGPVYDAIDRICKKWARHHRTIEAFKSSAGGLWVTGEQRYPRNHEAVTKRIGEMMFLYATIQIRPDLARMP